MEPTGARLKKVRLEKGLSLEEVHKKTKLHLNILKGLEEDSLIDFNPVYIRGFLKIYCNFLDVDPKDYLPDYKEPKARVEYVSDFKKRPASLFKIPALKLPSLKVIGMNTGIILTITLILALIVGLFNLGKIISSKRSLVSKRAGLTSVSVVTPRAENKTNIAKAQDLAEVKIIRLDIRAKENCFIQVKSDGRIVFQNVLKKGRSETWQATNRIELSLGNAAAVELEVDGKRISSLGRKGQALKNIQITKEGLSIKR